MPSPSGVAAGIEPPGKHRRSTQRHILAAPVLYCGHGATRIRAAPRWEGSFVAAGTRYRTYRAVAQSLGIPPCRQPDMPPAVPLQTA